MLETEESTQDNAPEWAVFLNGFPAVRISRLFTRSESLKIMKRMAARQNTDVSAMSVRHVANEDACPIENRHAVLKERYAMHAGLKACMQSACLDNSFA